MLESNHNTRHFVVASKLPSGITDGFISRVVISTLENISWVPDGDISLAFVSKQRSRIINNEFAKNNYPTDVLSFDYSQDKQASEYVGEIVICHSIAREQAKKYKIDFKSEIALLIVHGIIHLSGLDHQSEAQKASFERLQSGILKSLDFKYHMMPW